MTNYPKGTTKEQWDQYELDQKNHEAWVDGRREFMNDILSYVETHGIEETRAKFNGLLGDIFFMDAPNKPGYYRANND
jgi:hypothetical protein